MHKQQTVNIFIACDFSVMLNGLKLLIDKEKEFKVTGEANDINDIFKLLDKAIPDIIIIHLNIELETLDSLCKNIHKKYQNLPIFTISEGFDAKFTS